MAWHGTVCNGCVVYTNMYIYICKCISGIYAVDRAGIALQELGELEEAASCYERAISLAPDYVLAHYNLAYVRQDQVSPCFPRLCVSPGASYPVVFCRVIGRISTVLSGEAWEGGGRGGEGQKQAQVVHVVVLPAFLFCFRALAFFLLKYL